ncbi:MAG TPA: S-adenosylmethionine decarboxylase [Candidatus Paceibacterota bacterium]|nr:S-adenosylmethionine decarboxylase [Candidatus Paceibacterota bacterium]
MSYGKELILDLHECDVSTFNRKNIEEYLKKLCEIIDMERQDLHFWDYTGVPEEELPTEAHLLGTSAVQFISTSDIVIHTLDILKKVFLNIFSCKDFDVDVASSFSEEYFKGKIVTKYVIERQ